VSAALDGGPIDVLVNNAGYALRSAVEETDDDKMLQQFDTNVFGVVRLVRAVASKRVPTASWDPSGDLRPGHGWTNQHGSAACRAQDGLPWPERSPHPA
jgi:NAD(P)-dependent dehydrogenase (short-subunit alcohol dehydrogenase family)